MQMHKMAWHNKDEDSLIKLESNMSALSMAAGGTHLMSSLEAPLVCCQKADDVV